MSGDIGTGSVSRPDQQVETANPLLCPVILNFFQLSIATFLKMGYCIKKGYCGLIECKESTMGFLMLSYGIPACNLK